MNLNVLKGMLIILVIADHNDFTRSLFPGFFLGLSFHVVGFMTVPFLRAAEPVGTRRFADYVFRLYWPFMVVTCALWLWLTVKGDTPLAQRLAMLAHALYSGNANLLKEVTNMGLLWFLPSFISLVALRNLVDTSGPAVRYGAWMVLALAHVLIGAVALRIEDYLPLGILPALYMMPLAYIGVALHRRLLGRLPPWVALLLAAAAFAAVKTVQVRWQLPNEVGFSAVADWRDPQALLVNDLEAVTGTLMLFQIARLDFAGLLATCGEYSMQIYLFHAFVAFALYQLMLQVAPGLPVPLQFGATLLATIFLTLALAAGFMRLPLLRRMLFPHAPADLPRP